MQVSELVDNWPQLLQYNINGQELAEAFHRLDLNKDGYVRIAELKVYKIHSLWAVPENNGSFLSCLLSYAYLYLM